MFHLFGHFHLLSELGPFIGCERTDQFGSIGMTDHVGAVRGLIQTRAALGDWKDRLLADPTRFMESYLATAQKAA